jgi:Ca2+-binding EF-hand superfamily protein
MLSDLLIKTTVETLMYGSFAKSLKVTVLHKSSHLTGNLLKQNKTLTAMGQQPTEEELFQMISEVDENMSGAIDFSEFLQVIDNQKERS